MVQAGFSMHAAYAALLADARRLIMSQYAGSTRFFSSTQMRTSWQSNRDNFSQLVQPVVAAPQEISYSPPLQEATFKPLIQTSVLPKESASSNSAAFLQVATEKVQSPAPANSASARQKAPLTRLSAPQPVSAVANAPIKNEIQPLSEYSRHRLTLQPPPAIEPFAVEEWKTSLGQFMPTLKTHDVVPLPFGARLWATQEQDWLVLFIDEMLLSAATEAFVQSIKNAAQVLLAPIGCLPMQQLTEWRSKTHVGSQHMLLEDLESYLKEPGRKKQLWNELEALYKQMHSTLIQTIEP